MNLVETKEYEKYWGQRMMETVTTFIFTFKDGRIIERITTFEAAQACAKAWDCRVEAKGERERNGTKEIRRPYRVAYNNPRSSGQTAFQQAINILKSAIEQNALQIEIFEVPCDLVNDLQHDHYLMETALEKITEEKYNKIAEETLMKLLIKQPKASQDDNTRT